MNSQTKTNNSGIPYVSIAYLVDQCTKSVKAEATDNL